MIASPVYNLTFPAQLKSVLDRFQRYFEARFERGVRQRLLSPRRAVLLLTMGRHDPLPVEICEKTLRQSFSVMNTHLTGTLCLPDTDGGIAAEHPIFEKARRMAIEIEAETCYNNLNLCGLKAGFSMSGHSKWNNIKRKKGKTDGARQDLLKIGRELAVAVKEGGSADPAANSSSRLTLSPRRRPTMCRTNIERIIKKAAGEGKLERLREHDLRGLRPGRRRGHCRDADSTTATVPRATCAIISTSSRQPGTTGCVLFMFQQKGASSPSSARASTEDTVMSDAPGSRRIRFSGRRGRV